MKQLNLLVWITQLGLSVAVPLVGFIWLAVWLRSRFGLGNWILAVGILLVVTLTKILSTHKKNRHPQKV